MKPLPPDVRVSETPVTVRSYELDSFGHVNHAVFLNYFELGRFEALREGGFPYQRIVERGWGVYVVRIEVDYLAEARLDDRLLVRTWLEGYRRSSTILGQEIVPLDDAGRTLARARVTAVWVGADRRPMKVPDEVHAALGPPASPPADRP
ncbi:MAG TPA: thioesterase family protein [Longimicrobiales bacterium]|nr:thioesterase family protein [Longimicrobiales bacterium]